MRARSLVSSSTWRSAYVTSAESGMSAVTTLQWSTLAAASGLALGLEPAGPAEPGGPEMDA